SAPRPPPQSRAGAGRDGVSALKHGAHLAHRGKTESTDRKMGTEKLMRTADDADGRTSSMKSVQSAVKKILRGLPEFRALRGHLLEWDCAVSVFQKPETTI